MPGSSGSARVAFAAVRSAFADPVFVAALAEVAAAADRFAGVSFAGVGFAGVGSAPSPSARPNEARQKNNKREAIISGNLAKVSAYLAEAASYARRGCLPWAGATNPQPILFAAESKAHSAFPQFLQLRDERGDSVWKITIIPPKLLSIGAEHNNSGESHHLVLLGEFSVLLSKLETLRFATREIEFHDDQIVASVVLKLRLQQDLPVELFAPPAPVRPGKIQQQQFVTSLGFLLRFLEISEPARLLRAGKRPGDKSSGHDRKKKKTVDFHVTTFDGNITRRKSPENIRNQRNNYFFAPQIARRTTAGLSTGWDLPQMLRDELGHLEHAHLALAVEHRPE